ncbi:hypothetical protein [Actinokineospora globicatena]|uniref:hypothetical protein n=1 Tax=Actinokineospora globicatena TaxID=103729 RepID=UPI0020A4B4EF|nr:hypothetical protein [Actinokineospora globicatena]MCP2302081.1 hypothetical protein [Actinokineospora globicatena]GLW76257.1 hypothetical protein Aglo01_07390 [Actinokineospora globicatena]GLW83093.1 hypothetical protein Aglo02_07330 [Actinokineospora globicatena]
MSTIAPVTTPDVAAPSVTVRALVPGGLIVLLFLACGVLALLAPNRDDGRGISRITIEHADGLYALIPGEVLDCVRQDDRTAVCTMDVLGKPLRVATTYDEYPSRDATCVASYAGQARSCVPNYSSDTSLSLGAVLADGLGLTRAEFDTVAAGAMPWWRFDNGMPIVVPFMLFVLPLAAALVVGFSGPAPAAKATLLMVGVAVGWLALLAFSKALFSGVFADWLQPAAVIGGCTVLAWQWALTRPGWRTGWARGVVAYVAGTVPCVVALAFMLVGGGYVD